MGENADAWAKVQEGHASHAADWKQANEILCTLNAQSTACNNLPCPAVTKPALAAGVADADCSEATTATPAATPTTVAPTSAGNCPATCIGYTTCDSQIMAMVKNDMLNGDGNGFDIQHYGCPLWEVRGCDCGGCLCDVDALATAYPSWA